MISGIQAMRVARPYMIRKLAVMNPAPMNTSTDFHRHIRSTRWPIGIFSAQGNPAQNASPATKAADTSRYSLTKNVPTTEVMPEAP